jgi:hypothetical protein
MRRGTGLAIGAGVVSVTIGVLVGLVLYVGQVQRADRGPGATGPASTAMTTGTDSIAGSRTGDAAPAPAATGAVIEPPAGTPSSLPPGGATSTPETGGDQLTDDTTPGTTTPGTTTGTTTVPTTGPNAADEPCAALAARTADAAGTTLYCQRDQVDGTLRWRAVVDRGGCLNQAMTGRSADGIDYHCRLDSTGNNHWARR